MGMKQDAIKKMNNYIKEYIEPRMAEMEKAGVIFDSNLKEVRGVFVIELHLSIAVPSEEWEDEIEKSGGRSKIGKSEYIDFKTTTCFEKVVKKEGMTYICLDFVEDKANFVKSALWAVEGELIGGLSYPRSPNIIEQKLFERERKKRSEKYSELRSLIESDEDVLGAFKKFMYYYFIYHTINNLKNSELYSNVKAKIEKKKAAISAEKSTAYYQGLVKF